MDGHLAADGAGGFAVAVAMWLGMVVVMMTPTVTPWVRAYATLVAPSPGRRFWCASTTFVAGYLAVWLAYSLGMAALQVALARAGALVDSRLTTPAGGLVLIAAGLYQFAPLKAACLTHCRNPLTYFLARWKNGPVGGFRMGLAHGTNCLGCCWAVMLTALALGVMNLAWMLALTATVAVEQMLPAGVRVGRVFGALLVGWGAWLLA
ncbi:MAG: DUF2182 domain-containing protein [Acidobacteria bacterium]|nr:DUF2182 domain-containing protein [Acidobacteriota bacterium]